MTETTTTENQKTVLTGLQPTGVLTIGNYIGAIRNMLEYQKEHKCFYFVADLHSLTVDIEPATLRKNTLDVYALLIAFGIDPAKSTLFIQSHVPAHAELAWVLNCNAQFGEARRMTQFKDKSQKAPQNVNVGLFAYPMLMAADILLYQADYVPVGKDQNQHLEIARTIAERFNGRYSPTFKVPEGINPKFGAKVSSLADPAAKMSKSDDNKNGSIFLLDPKDEIMRKFKRAVTDSGSEIIYDVTNKPGISNLLTIYSSLSGKSIKDTEKEFAGKNYAQFKEAVGEAVCAFLAPVQSEYNRLVKDKEYLATLMKNGAEEAARVAYKTLSKVYRKVGLIGR